MNHGPDPDTGRAVGDGPGLTGRAVGDGLTGWLVEPGLTDGVAEPGLTDGFVELGARVGANVPFGSDAPGTTDVEGAAEHATNISADRPVSKARMSNPSGLDDA